MLAATKLGQVMLFLRVGATAINLVHAEIRVRAIAQPNRGRGTTDLFHGNALGEIAKASSAVYFVDCNTESAHSTEFWPEIFREVVVVIDTSGSRCDLGLRKCEDGIALLINIST